MHRRALVVSIVATVSAVGLAGPPAQARTTETAEPVPAQAPADSAALKWQVGFVNRGFGGNEPTAVSVFEDGQVIAADADAPYGFVIGQIDPLVMDLLAVKAEAVDPNADYGETMVTDVGDTVVTLGGPEPTVISVWALAHADGLSADQRTARERLQRFVDDLVEAGDEARATGEPYLPERVDIALWPVPPEEAVTAEPWPSDVLPNELSQSPVQGGWCFNVSLGDAPYPTTEELIWATPVMEWAVPSAVYAEMRAQLPGSEPCGGASPEVAGRPLTAEEAASTAYGWESPWIEGERSVPHPLEHWFVDEVMLNQVLPRELPGSGWDSTRWSWFDVGVVATEVDGVRYLDVHATCTPYVTDEEPVCTIDARLDPQTGDVIDFAAA